MRLGVQTVAETPGAALTQNSQQTQALITALRAANVAAADIQTQAVQLYPVFDDRVAQTVTQTQQTSYRAVNIVQVRVRSLDSLSTLLDVAVGAGTNIIDQVSLQVSDPTAALTAARQQAFADARAKAQQLAALAGAQLGEVITISEGSSFPSPVGLGGGAIEKAAVPIEPGTQSIQVDLQVTWRLR